MDPKRSRCRRIIQLSTQNNEDEHESQNIKPASYRNTDIAEPLSTMSPSDLNIIRNSPSTSTCHNQTNDDDGDFSPASDDDRTYFPSKKKCRRSNSSSSSSSLSSSSSSSSTLSTSSSSTSAVSARECPNTKQIQSTKDTHNNIDPTNLYDETENANSNMNDQMPNTSKIYDISFTQIVEVSNNRQRSDPFPADSNLQVGLAPNDVDHVASSSRADNDKIMHSDTNDTGEINDVSDTRDIDGFCPNDATIEVQAQPDNVITKKRKKKFKNVTTNIVKILRNAGKKYVSNSKKKTAYPAKMIKQPCGSACRLKCSERISEESRKLLFNDYWGMASLMRQREYIARNILEIKPRYQYKKFDSNRKPKMAFHFDVNGTQERICKTFFKNTLDITDRCIRTVIEKKNPSTGVLEGEKRGMHGNHRKVPAEMTEEVKKHINSIPRIESHYLRKQTTREFIDGGKTLTDKYQ